MRPQGHEVVAMPLDIDGDHVEAVHGARAFGNLKCSFTGLEVPVVDDYPPPPPPPPKTARGIVKKQKNNIGGAILRNVYI